MKRTIAAVLLAAVMTASCSSSPSISKSASAWLVAQVSAARDAAARGDLQGSLAQLTDVQSSVATFRTSHAITAQRADEILAALARARRAVMALSTTTTATPSTTTAPAPNPPRHDHGDHGRGHGGD